MNTAILLVLVSAAHLALWASNVGAWVRESSISFANTCIEAAEKRLDKPETFNISKKNLKK